jgi:hypothetical protein
MGKSDSSNAFDLPSINQQLQEKLKTKATFVYLDGKRLLVKAPKQLLPGLATIVTNKEKHCKVCSHKISVLLQGGIYHIKSRGDFAFLEFVTLAQSVSNTSQLSALLG